MYYYKWPVIPQNDQKFLLTSFVEETMLAASLPNIQSKFQLMLMIGFGGSVFVAENDEVVNVK